MGLITKVSKAQSRVSVLQSRHRLQSPCCSREQQPKEISAGRGSLPALSSPLSGCSWSTSRRAGDPGGFWVPSREHLLLSWGESGPAVCAGAHTDVGYGGGKGSSEGGGSSDASRGLGVRGEAGAVYGPRGPLSLWVSAPRPAAAGGSGLIPHPLALQQEGSAGGPLGGSVWRSWDPRISQGRCNHLGLSLASGSVLQPASGLP